MTFRRRLSTKQREALYESEAAAFVKIVKIVADNCNWSVTRHLKVFPNSIEITFARDLFGSPLHFVISETINPDWRQGFSAGTLAGALIRHENLWAPLCAMKAKRHGAIEAQDAGYLTGRP